MNLENVKTIEDIVRYSEGLANDIESGITDDNGICNDELIADFAAHCATLAKQKFTSEQKNIFIASTGDASINIIIRAKDIKEAVIIANNEYSEESDEVDFIFAEEDLTEINTIGKSQIIEVF